MSKPTSTIRPGHDIPLEPLLTRVASGDRDAFEALYRRTSAKLFGICVRVMSQRADAEEVLQEAFTAVWRNAAQFDPVRASAIAWLSMIARNKAIDRLRTRSLRQPDTALEEMQDTADPSASPLSDTQSMTDRARLDACLQQLDSRHRALIHSAFFEGFTYEELSGRAGAPLGSVKSWIRRALLQLRACLES